MNKFEIVINLEHIAEQRNKWNAAYNEFGKAVDQSMRRLIHEAAAQRMSVFEVSKAVGMAPSQIKTRMRAMNLNPTTGKTLLSRQAAAVLESNAEIMGIKPHEIDLMSPLVYLPAGKDVFLETNKGVTDLDDKPLGSEAWQMIAKLEDAGVEAKRGYAWMRSVLAEAAEAGA